MDDINKIIDELKLENQLKLDDVPNIDLYMDQVIQLFEEVYKDSKRNEDEKILTKTMINNYAKGKLLFPIKNKKYSKEHLLLISLIYQLKGVLSINDIKILLKGLNEKIVHEDFEFDQFYNRYLALTENNVRNFRLHVNESAEEVQREIQHLEHEDSSYIEKVLLISTLVNMSNNYRKAAERLVDQIVYKKEDEKDK